MDVDLPTLSRRELVNTIAYELGITQAKAGPVVHRTLDSIAEALAQNRRVEIRGLGVFELRSRQSQYTKNPRTKKDQFSPVRYYVRFKQSSKLRGLNPKEMSFACMSLLGAAMAADDAVATPGVVNDAPMKLEEKSEPKDPEFSMQFVTEKRARRFAAMALAKLPGSKVTIKGHHVKVSHRPHQQSAVFAMASRAAARRKAVRHSRHGGGMLLDQSKDDAQPNPPAAVAPPVAPAAPAVKTARDPDQKVLRRLYFQYTEDADLAHKALIRAGCKVRRGKPPFGDHSMAVIGRMSTVNAIAYEFHANPVPVEKHLVKSQNSDPGEKTSLQDPRARGDKAAFVGMDSTVSTWRIPIPRSPSSVIAVASALKRKGLKATSVGNNVVVYDISYDALMRAMRTTTVEIKVPGGGGATRVVEVYLVPGMGDVSEDPGHRRVVDDKGYTDRTKSTAEIFYQYVADFASEAVATKVASVLASMGVDITNAGGGVLAMGLREVVRRAVEDIIARYKGRVKSKAKKQGKNPVAPKVSTPVSAPTQQRGFFQGIFSRKTPQSPFAPVETPPSSSRSSSRAPVIQPPKGDDRKGYGVQGKRSKMVRKDKDRGIFSFEFAFHDQKGRALGQNDPLADIGTPDVGAGLDWIGISEAVMEFISTPETRAVIDKLTAAGLKVARAGSHKIVATVTSPEAKALVTKVVGDSGGRVKFLKKVLTRGKSASHSGVGMGMERDLLDAAEGLVLLTFATTSLAIKAAGLLASKGFEATARGSNVIVKGTREQLVKAKAWVSQKYGQAVRSIKQKFAPKGASMAGTGIARSEWKHIPWEDAERGPGWQQHEQARRRYAQGKGPKPGAYNPKTGKSRPNFGDYYKGKYGGAAAVGTILVLQVAGNAGALYLASKLEHLGIRFSRAKDRLIAKVAGLKDAEAVRKAVTDAGGKIIETRPATDSVPTKGAAFASPSTMERLLPMGVMIVTLAGVKAAQAVQQLREAGIKAKLQRDELAKITDATPEDIQRIAAIAKQNNLTLKQQIQKHDAERPYASYRRVMDKIGKPVVGALGAAAVLYFAPKTPIVNLLKWLTEQGIKYRATVQKAAEAAGRGTVQVTSLTPEQMAKFKRAAQKFGTVKLLGKSASLSHGDRAKSRRARYKAKAMAKQSAACAFEKCISGNGSLVS